MAIIKGKRPLPGVRLKHHKQTADHYTVKLPIPAEVKIPMRQHMGPSCSPIVKVGDTVFVGQKIGDSDAKNGVPVHASVSGTVKAIGEYLCSDGKMDQTVVIESDGRQSLLPSLAPPSIKDRETFIDAVRDSGLCGLGGAGFPTHLKLAYDSSKHVDTLIVNAAECEPYITSDQRTCIEQTQQVVDGIKSVMHYLGIPRCVIGIERNKPDAIELLAKVTNQVSGISVMPLKTIYPQGAEKVLIYSATGRVIEEGQLPVDVGALVMNVSTLAQLDVYCTTGMPLVSRRLTVDGDAVENPQNVEVPIGTPIGDVLRFCGLKENAKEILMGGPMMGMAVSDLEQPVLKNNNAIVAFLNTQPSYTKTTNCIRCGKCARVCPVSLMPAGLERAYDNRNSEMLRKMKVNLCINCGCCSYICPAKRDLAAKNQLGKQLLREENKTKGTESKK